ncbi:hypothetical protein PoB_001134500 [Plakobranchus ocellatus]|uniref:Uncharacterized protein n=1 Tax=Plakobranchus ocellatus TaxID=259542 RepID=A0AAV3YQ49_9GAST|nr:hypothetical protein PoB_001134500 [Plakobranchus ocellatus]
MRVLTILLLVVAASLVLAVSCDEEKHRGKRLFGGFMKMVKTFKDRISGVARNVGKAARASFGGAFQWATDRSRFQFIDARKSFRKIDWPTTLRKEDIEAVDISISPSYNYHKPHLQQML